MNKTVFKKEICNYCQMCNKECPHFKDILYVEENDIKTMKCIFYKKNLTSD